MSEKEKQLNDAIGLHLETAERSLASIKGKLTGYDRTALTQGQQAVMSAQTAQADLTVELAKPPVIEIPPTQPPPTGGSGAVVFVPAGGNLQAALDNAGPRSVVEIEAGAKYPGPYTWRNNASSEYVTLRTRGVQRAGRTKRSDAAGLGQIMSTALGNAPLKALPGAHHLIMEDVTFTQDVGQTWSLVELGRGEETNYDQVPHHFIFNRCAMTVPDHIQVRRGIALNAFDVDVIDTAIWNIKEIGNDSQAISGRLGGRHRFINSELEGAGENVIFGGSPASIANAMVRDVLIENCSLPKNPKWRKDSPEWDGSNWQIKNNFEVKAGERIKLLNVTMDGCWQQAQDGCAVLLTVRCESGVNPWATIQDVHFENITIKNVGAGFQFLYADDSGHPSVPAKNWTFRNIYVEATIKRGGSGRIMEGSPIENLIVDNVTAITDGTSAYYFRSDHPAAKGFQFRNIAYLQNLYGFWTEGKPFDTVFPGAVWENVTVGVDGPNTDYPPPKPSTAISKAAFITKYKKP